MKSHIICTAAVLSGCILLTTGCIQKDSLLNEAGDIRFGAEMLLMQNGASTKAVLDRTTFNQNESFSLFGSVHSDGTETLVFSGNPGDAAADHGVTVTNIYNTEWTYDDLRSWDWKNTSDYYDFMGIYPSGVSTRMDIPGNLAVSTHCDISSGSSDDRSDLLCAAYRRKGNVQDRCGRVNLQFYHVGAAVGVVIINDSDDTSVLVEDIHFKNLTVSGDAKVTLDNYGSPVYSWINTERSASEVRTTTPNETVAAGNTYAGEHVLMIPQRLDQAVGAGSLEENMPQLILSYRSGDAATRSTTISLKDVQRADGSSISSWEIGYKYTYYINMRLDGGLLVSLVTTAWDPVEAQTPGLLIL